MGDDLHINKQTNIFIANHRHLLRQLFGALFAYVNNIQITWKTIHLSVFCRTNSPSTDQSRAEGNNTESMYHGR
jgi:hypothetical protein